MARIEIPTTLSGDIVTAEDATIRNAIALTVAIEPVQAGTGDPSPENVRPISGHSTATVTRTGKNILDTKNATWKKFYISNNVFTVLSDSASVVSYTINNDYSISASNSSTYRGIGFSISPVDYDRVISISDTESGNNGLRLYSSYTTGASSIRTTTASSLPIYAGESGFLCVLFKTSGSHAFTLQIELGSSATVYESPNIQTVTIDLDGTRYGGVLDVLTGTMTVTDGNIASYDGGNASVNLDQ